MRKSIGIVVAVILVATTLALGVFTGASADVDPNASDHSVEYFPSFDGVMLHADVWRPANLAPGQKTPVILTVSPYAGSGGHALDPDPFGGGPGTPGGGIFALGYSRAIVSLRGTGASGGCMDLFGPGEIGDSKAAVEYFADTDADQTNDGRWTGKVAMTGSSYDGFTQIAAMAAHADGLALVVAGAPPTGYQNFFHNRVRNTGGGHGFAALYTASDKVPPSIFAPPEEHINAFSSPTANGCLYADTVIGSYNNDPQAPYWQARDLAELGAIGSSVPTIWRQGFNDWQVRPTGFADIFASLTGPRLGIFGPWDHGASQNGQVFNQIVARWLDRYLKDGPHPGTPEVLVQDFDGSWRAESDWPPGDAGQFALSLNDGSYMDHGGNNGETGYPDAFGMIPAPLPEPLPTGEGIWTFSKPLEHEVHISGIPEVTANINSLVPGVHLVAIVYDVDAVGMARMVTRGVTLVPCATVSDNPLVPCPPEITIDLYPQDWRFPPGHRIGVLVTGADDIWFEPGTSGTPVDVTEAHIALPVLGCLRASDLAEGEGPFRGRTSHGDPFQVNQGTIDASTVGDLLPLEPTRCSIGDLVWNDLNGDGQFEPAIGESGIGSVEMTLDIDGNGDGAYEETRTATTDSNGFYSFGGVQACQCRVSVDPATLPPGSMPTYDLDGTSTPNSAEFTLTAGQPRTDVDFGYFLLTGGGGTIGSFVLGDLSSGVGPTVTFWGSEWSKNNSLSKGSASSSFKGFAAKTSSPPSCGSTWTTGPGNSPPPPASVPEYMGVLVSSKITKSGSIITGERFTGDVVEIVIVKTNPGYSSDPGHTGTGTVVAVLCS